ncbi:MAG: hypothetical protein AAF600_01325 [Bacteroidota bacterium]
MQKLISITLIITLHAQPVANGVVVLDFLLNQEYIKEFLCINKERPEVACNGKCYLMQQLKETQKKKEKDIPVLWSSRLEFILMSFEEEQIEAQKIIRKETFFWNDISYPFLFEKDIFHPPII